MFTITTAYTVTQAAATEVILQEPEKRLKIYVRKLPTSLQTSAQSEPAWTPCHDILPQRSP